MNNVNLIGRMTKDVELRYTQSGMGIVRFTLAVDRPKKDSGADFIRCTAFGATAEAMDKYVNKGDRIGITGHIKTGSYEKNGEKVYTFDVNVDRLEFLESRKNAPAPANNPAPAPAPANNGGVYDEDIPF